MALAKMLRFCNIDDSVSRKKSKDSAKFLNPTLSKISSQRAYSPLLQVLLASPIISYKNLIASNRGAPSSVVVPKKNSGSIQKSRTDTVANPSRTENEIGLKVAPELLLNEHIRIGGTSPQALQIVHISEISQTSTGNYDSESAGKFRSISFDGKVSPPPIRNRPLSEYRKFNDTYISSTPLMVIIKFKFQIYLPSYIRKRL
ncbi:AIF_collapsed_G0010940.mRNA.1.CDS.1 [Saccharomyces cerevisiae]|nr:AIF_collapsed_G0010940.mRNA.1.CDS.1 [Saccharomyces cerevisiae]